MELSASLHALSAKIPKIMQEGMLRTEEGTKNALIMPFIQALGYNVFDPLEVTPELVADVPGKRGEKVDYAILKDGKPIMLFECKIAGTNLSNVHAAQLYRYFTTTAARFGVLTDGTSYRFYTDLDQPNIMDRDPFFVFDMLDIKESQVEELKKFSKANYDAQGIITAASQLKYKGLIKLYLAGQMAQPGEPFIRVLLQESKAYTGRLTQQVIDSMAPTVREAFRLFVIEQVDQRLKSALARDAEPTPAQPPAVEPEEPTVAIVTTQEEIEAYFIVKSILRETVDARRITMRDAQSYCSILLDDNNRKPICRLRFTTKQKYVGVFNDQRAEERIAIESLDDLYRYGDKLKAAIAYYEHRPAPAADAATV